MELIPLAANTIAVSRYYMAAARSSSNGLDLGLFHEKVKAHVRHLSTNPHLFLRGDITAKELCLDQEPFCQPEVLKALQREAKPKEDVLGSPSFSVDQHSIG